MTDSLRNFERFNRTLDGRAGSPRSISVRIAPPATVAITKAAAQALGFPDQIAYLFDREARRLAISKATPDDPNRYNLRKQSGNVYVCSAKSLIRSLDLPTIGWTTATVTDTLGPKAIIIDLPDWNPPCPPSTPTTSADDSAPARPTPSASTASSTPTD